MDVLPRAVKVTMLRTCLYGVWARTQWPTGAVIRRTLAKPHVIRASPSTLTVKEIPYCVRGWQKLVMTIMTQVQCGKFNGIGVQKGYSQSVGNEANIEA